MPEIKNEREIIEGCLKNNRRAQKALYQAYCSKFLGICLRYAKDKQEAEDVLQEGFVKIFNRIGQFSGSGSFEGWLKRIIINTAITNYRQNLKRYNQVPVDFLPEDETEVNSTDFEYTYDELLKVVQSLPAGYRMVFNLFAIEGYQHKEIAEMLDVDVATSKSQYSRARKLLQKKLVELKTRNLIAETR